jgi:hypothetical protein
MAQKFEIPGGYAWGPEQCEELILIAGYEEIYRYISADQTWKYDFETHFFDRGVGVAVKFVDAINAVRKRYGLEVIVVRETDVYDCGRSQDRRFKADHRRRIREELKDASADERRRRIEGAKAEEQRLPPPRTTLEEYKVRKQQQARSGLTSKELSKRAIAHQAASTAPTKPKLSLVERTAKMLTLTTSLSIRGEIIQNLSADDALEVAERIEDTELRDALVRHSLGAS